MQKLGVSLSNRNDADSGSSGIHSATSVSPGTIGFPKNPFPNYPKNAACCKFEVVFLCIGLS